MGDVTIKTGHTHDDAGMIVSILSTRPPFLTGVGIHAKEYVEGEDFDNSDDIYFEIPAIKEVKFAMFTEDDGSVISYTESALSGGGRQLKLTNVPDSNIKAFIVTDT